MQVAPSVFFADRTDRDSGIIEAPQSGKAEMDNLAKALIGLAALAFLLAVGTALLGVPILGVQPEGFSRACTNLALLSIGLSVCFGGKSSRL